MENHEQLDGESGKRSEIEHYEERGLSVEHVMHEQVSLSSEPRKEDTPRASTALRKARNRFLQRLVIVILLWFAHKVLEPTGLITGLERLGGEFLQHRLTGANSAGEEMLRVVDISSILLKPRGVEKNEVLITPRKPLTTVIDQIAERNPMAIGIDVYFEPDIETGGLPSEDEEFLDHCLNLKGKNQKPIPTFVGINTSVGRGPAHWLGYERFGPLGKEIVIPDWLSKEGTEGRLEERLKLPVNGTDVSAESMSAALSEVVRKEREQRGVKQPGVHASWFRRPRIDVKQDDIETSQFQTNFGLVEWLIAHKVPSDSLPNDVLSDKVVLVGRATAGETSDMFNIPGRGTPVPGIFVHAAAVDTLVNSPLYTLTRAGAFILDVLAVLVPLVFLFVFELILPKWMDWSPFVEEVLGGFIVALLCLFAYCLVSRLGIYWAGFLPVCFSLVIRIPGENRLEKVFKRVFGEEVV